MRSVLLSLARYSVVDGGPHHVPAPVGALLLFSPSLRAGVCVGVAVVYVAGGREGKGVDSKGRRNRSG